MEHKETSTEDTSAEIKPPKREHDTDSLPSAVTFFMDASQRKALLNALKRFSNNRSNAILIALDINRLK